MTVVFQNLIGMLGRSQYIEDTAYLELFQNLIGMLGRCAVAIRTAFEQVEFQNLIGMLGSQK